MSQFNRQIAEAIAEYIVGPTHTQIQEIVSAYSNVEQANDELHQLTGVRRFFLDSAALKEFQRLLTQPMSNRHFPADREWGDFQTPLHLARQVCQYLAHLQLSPQVIIEPTYGTGNFMLAAIESFPTAELVYGVEIQPKYEWHLKLALLIDALSGRRASATEIALYHDDIFTHRFPSDLLTAGSILIIGNPPWITNSELGALRSANVPQKRNLKTLSGLDALTGKSNFDLGEYSFKNYKVAIAGLYKEPRFLLVMPIDRRPTMLDDTCYFVGFDTYPDALFTASLLNNPVVRRLLQSIAFSDAKRPYTKDVLMRINLAQVAAQLPLSQIAAFWDSIGYTPRIPMPESDYEAYKQRNFKDQNLQYELGL